MMFKKLPLACLSSVLALTSSLAAEPYVEVKETEGNLTIIRTLDPQTGEISAGEYDITVSLDLKAQRHNLERVQFLIDQDSTDYSQQENGWFFPLKNPTYSQINAVKVSFANDQFDTIAAEKLVYRLTLKTGSDTSTEVFYAPHSQDTGLKYRVQTGASGLQTTHIIDLPPNRYFSQVVGVQITREDRDAPLLPKPNYIYGFLVENTEIPDIYAFTGLAPTEGKPPRQIIRTVKAVQYRDQIRIDAQLNYNKIAILPLTNVGESYAFVNVTFDGGGSHLFQRVNNQALSLSEFKQIKTPVDLKILNKEMQEISLSNFLIQYLDDQTFTALDPKLLDAPILLLRTSSLDHENSSWLLNPPEQSLLTAYHVSLSGQSKATNIHWEMLDQKGATIFTGNSAVTEQQSTLIPPVGHAGKTIKLINIPDAHINEIRQNNYLWKSKLDLFQGTPLLRFADKQYFSSAIDEDFLAGKKPFTYKLNTRLPIEDLQDLQFTPHPFLNIKGYRLNLTNYSATYRKNYSDLKN